MFRILFLGDIVGKVGREAVKAVLPQLISEHSPGIIIANGENSAGGIGINEKTANEIFEAGVDVITTGNHVWGKKEFVTYLNQHSDRVIRPLNYAEGSPGKGVCVFKTKEEIDVRVINAIGRIFTDQLVACPFRAIDSALAINQTAITFVDFHGEATSEKIALGYHLDGRVTAVVGTHTHVQTADERVMPRGTGFISDAGMCGPLESVIGVDPESVIKRFMSGRPFKYEVAKGTALVNGVIIDCDEDSGKALKIERLKLVLD